MPDAHQADLAGEKDVRATETDMGAHDLLPPTEGRHCQLAVQRKLTPVKIDPYPEGGKACGPGCKQVTFAASVRLGYDVDGDILAFASTTRADPEATMVPLPQKVHYVNLDTNEQWRLHRDTHWFGCEEGLAVDGDLIAYTCSWEYGGSATPVWTEGLATYNVSTGIEVDHYCALRERAKDHCGPSDVAAGPLGIVVNMGVDACIRPELLLYRFGQKDLESVAPEPTRIGSQPEMDGEHLVFETGNPETGFSNIMLYNVRTKERTFIDPQKAAQYTPRVSGNKVVWTDGRNEDPPGNYLSPKNGDIYIYDMDTKKIYFKVLSTGKIYQLTSEMGYEIFPRVSNGRIFYRALDDRSSLSIFQVDVEAWLAANEGT